MVAHWAYGTGLGAVRGLLGTMVGPQAAGAAHFAAVYGSQHALLPALDLAPPATEWGTKAIATDAVHHLVYAVVTDLAHRWLDLTDR